MYLQNLCATSDSSSLPARADCRVLEMAGRVHYSVGEAASDLISVLQYVIVVCVLSCTPYVCVLTTGLCMNFIISTRKKVLHYLKLVSSFYTKNKQD